MRHKCPEDRYEISNHSETLNSRSENDAHSRVNIPSPWRTFQDLSFIKRYYFFIIKVKDPTPTNALNVRSSSRTSLIDIWWKNMGSTK